MLGPISLFFYVFFAIWTQLRLTWTRFNRSLEEWLSYSEKRMKPGPQNHKTHKLVIIGDGFAEGLGDWVTLFENAGVAKYLPHYLYADKGRPRLQLVVLNRGVTGSKSEFWRPDRVDEPTYFRNVFESKRCQDVDAVLITVGSADSVETNEDVRDTVENIKKICAELRKRGKLVYVSTIPSVKTSERRKQRNQLIKEFAFGNKLGVKLGPDMTSKAYENPDFWTLGGSYFCSTGYKKCAEDWKDCIMDDLKKIEWEYFKAYFNLNLDQESNQAKED